MDSLAYHEREKLIEVLLKRIIDLETEVGELKRRNLKIAMCGCVEHAKELSGGGRLPVYCAVCGKPHTGHPDKMWTYRELKGMYDSALSDAGMWENERDHYVDFLRGLGDGLEDVLVHIIDRGSVDHLSSEMERIINDIDEELDHEGRTETED